jgi:spore coat protein CotH
MKTAQLFTSLLLVLALFSCRDEESIIENIETTSAEESSGIEIDTPDWTELTHGITTPNYDVVFAQNEVLRIDLVISDDEWETMQDDLDDNLSSSSSRGGITDVDFDPVWVPCSVLFDSIEWYKVGVRYKGNSSLSSTYSSGVGKFSFKLDFDQFESDYSSITDQRFYGFKQLNLKNNYLDQSLVREKVASDLFLSFGLAGPQTSFYEVYVDHGSGTQYYGLYTMVEEVDDTVLDHEFDDGSGNLYKPDGDAATFYSGTYDESEMEKQTNIDLDDYTDTYALYSAVNSSLRSSDSDAWTTLLESSFDVSTFLKWLAANTTMQNWDTYGNMTHNFYLYNNPDNMLLTWIPWDNNEALEYGMLTGSLDLDLTKVSNYWPLISYLIDIPEYEEEYQEYLEQFITEVFIPDEMSTLYSSYYLLLKESVYAEENGYSFLSYDSQFDSAISTLKSHASTRYNAVINYLY